MKDSTNGASTERTQREEKMTQLINKSPGSGDFKTFSSFVSILQAVFGPSLVYTFRTHLQFRENSKPTTFKFKHPPWVAGDECEDYRSWDVPVKWAGMILRVLESRLRDRCDDVAQAARKVKREKLSQFTTKLIISIDVGSTFFTHSRHRMKSRNLRRLSLSPRQPPLQKLSQQTDNNPRQLDCAKIRQRNFEWKRISRVGARNFYSHTRASFAASRNIKL